VDGGTDAALGAHVALALEPALPAAGEVGGGKLSGGEAVEGLPVAFLGRAEVLEEAGDLGLAALDHLEQGGEALAAARLDQGCRPTPIVNVASWKSPACEPRPVKVDTRVYTSGMSRRAKLFQNGGSQAVRLPKECRFEGQQEVVARREGELVILEPIDRWPEEFLACLGTWDEPIERPPQSPVTTARDPFA